ncbi:MAG: hypothetical protein MJA30_05965 [Cytophagales bacterium]|nr:hypothetical protein [Cytophagales bacterium]
MKIPFEKVRNIYGERLEEMPNRANQRPMEDLEEIMSYNRAKNEKNKKGLVVFNTLIVLSVGVFIVMLFLYLSGKFTSLF